MIWSENIDISRSSYERRGILHAVIEIPNRAQPIHAICIHLGLFEADRAHQIRQLCERINQLVPQDEPLVVAGDFNDWREQTTQTLRERASLQEVFIELKRTHARTFPCWMPILRLDRIYFRGLAALSAQCLSGQPWKNLSDHAAILAHMKV